MDEALRQLVMERLAPADTGPPAEDGVPPAASAADVASLLSGQVSDPLMAALLGSMLNRQQAPTAEVEPDAEHKLQRARAVIRRLRRDLAVAEAMAVYIGETFGACHSCWGLNRTCPQCRGQGGPGFTEPNEEELLAWVRPALTRLGLELSRAP